MKLLAACLMAVASACGTASVQQGVDGVESVGGLPKDTSDIEQALVVLPSARVVARHDDNIPLHVNGNLGQAPAAAVTGDVSSLGSNLRQIAPVFRLHAEDLQLVRVEGDELGHTHYRFQQLKNGLPVVGGELSVHL